MWFGYERFLGYMFKIPGTDHFIAISLKLFGNSLSQGEIILNQKNSIHNTLRSFYGFPAKQAGSKFAPDLMIIVLFCNMFWR